MPEITIKHDANELIVGIGSDAVEASRQAGLAAASAAYAESMTGPTYASTAAGLAATTDGQGFAVDNGDGTVTVYLNDGGVAVAQRTLATTAALASTDAGKGAALVARSGPSVSTRTLASALDGNSHDRAFLTEAGYEGDFVTRAATDYSDLVALDTQQADHIPLTGFPNLVLVREREGVIKPRGVGNGSDDNAAVYDAWRMAMARPTSATNGWCIELDDGPVLITDNNLLGKAGLNGQYFRSVIRGRGPGSTEITFAPQDGDEFVSGDKSFYLYDGGSVASPNSFALVRPFFQGMSILLDDSGLIGGTSDTVGLARINGDIANQNFRLDRARVLGCGSATGGNAKSLLWDIVGSINGSECYTSFCELRELTHLHRTSNPQAVDLAYLYCDPWLIFSDFFVHLAESAGEVRVHGGSWIWHDTPDGADQYLLNFASASGLGINNLKCVFESFKPEMRAAASKLVNCPYNTNALDVTFANVNFAGANIDSDGNRDVLYLGQQKRVSFNECVIPKEFGYRFAAETTGMGSIVWAATENGLVEHHNCTMTGSLAERITLDGNVGRVVARGSKRLTGAASAHQKPLDFDSSPFAGGSDPLSAREVMAQFIPAYGLWTSGKQFKVEIPYGARLQRIRVFKPGGGSATSRTMTLKDGAGATLDTYVANEDAGHFIDYEVAAPNNMVARTALNDRTFTVEMDTVGSPVRGGGGWVYYV